MQVVSWNINGGASRAKLDWLLGKTWDVALLQEVSDKGWKRLKRHDDYVAISTIEHVPAPRRGVRRLAATILLRPPLQARPSPSPLADDDPFREQCLAVTLAGSDITLVSFHAPNAAERDQSEKERCIGALSDWLVTQVRVVVGADLNVGRRTLDDPARPFHERMANQLEFVCSDARHGLIDSYRFGARDQSAPWTYCFSGRSKPDRRDYLFASRKLSVNNAGIWHDALSKSDSGHLSDHAAVWADYATT